MSACILIKFNAQGSAVSQQLYFKPPPHYKHGNWIKYNNLLAAEFSSAAQTDPGGNTGRGWRPYLSRGFLCAGRRRSRHTRRSCRRSCQSPTRSRDTGCSCTLLGRCRSACPRLPGRRCGTCCWPRPPGTRSGRPGSQARSDKSHSCRYLQRHQLLYYLLITAHYFHVPVCLLTDSAGLFSNIYHFFFRVQLVLNQICVRAGLSLLSVLNLLILDLPVPFKALTTSKMCVVIMKCHNAIPAMNGMITVITQRTSNIYMAQV